MERLRSPEWVGEDRIDEGQLTAAVNVLDFFFLLGYLRLPENECECLMFWSLGDAGGSAADEHDDGE